MKARFFAFLKKRKVIVIVVAIAVVALASGAVYASQMWRDINHDQMQLFNQGSTTVSDDPQETEDSYVEPKQSDDGADPAGSAEAVAAPTPTPNPLDVLSGQADPTISHDILNVLLIGVDWADERVDNTKDYVGKNFNSDVMLDLAINFKQNKVDMISAPRDSYAKIANLNGVYKLNFALTAGDNGKISDKAFMNVCKSVQYLFDMNGQIPINYYIGVTMPVVKELADTIGGVDFNVDVAFTIDGRSYNKGMQHLDGQGVLDYCRVRKGDISADPGDLNRVNRQKDLLLAVFKKLQSSSDILNVPKILTGMSGKVYTNLNFAQLAALAVFGSKLQTGNIAMHTMPGSYDNGIFNKNYVLIDQQKRVQLMEQVFGIPNIAVESRYSAAYAKLYWAYLQSKVAVSVVQKIQSQDSKLTPDQQKLTDAAQNAQLADALTEVQKQIQIYQSSAHSDLTQMQNALDGLVELATQMFTAAGYKVNWTVPVSMYEPGMKMKE